VSGELGLLIGAAENMWVGETGIMVAVMLVLAV
jgi:hypothetical protein